MPKIKIILSSFIAIVGVLIASVAPAGASSWSGMLHVYDKTHGDMLMQDGDTFYARHHTNVVFAPEGMGPNAHHFTIIAKDQETGKWSGEATARWLAVGVWSIQPRIATLATALRRVHTGFKLTRIKPTVLVLVTITRSWL